MKNDEFLIQRQSRYFTCAMHTTIFPFHFSVILFIFGYLIICKFVSPRRRFLNRALYSTTTTYSKLPKVTAYCIDKNRIQSNYYHLAVFKTNTHTHTTPPSKWSVNVANRSKAIKRTKLFIFNFNCVHWLMVNVFSLLVCFGFVWFFSFVLHWILVIWTSNLLQLTKVLGVEL